MAIEFKKTAARDKLYALALENSVAVAADADKPTIIAALDAYNAQEAADASGPTGNTTPDENAPQGGVGATANPTGADDPDDSDPDDSDPDDSDPDGDDPDGDDPDGDDPDDSDPDDSDPDGDDPDEYNAFVYVGPTLPRGRLKENAVFRGAYKDVTAYLKDVLEDYPQAAKLIFPAHKLGEISVKVKKPGNVLHKYYGDIASAMRKREE